MNPQTLQRVLKDAELLYPTTVVEAAISRLARQISQDLAERFPVVYCIMTGGVVFAGQLLPRLAFPLDFQYLHASRYRGKQQGEAELTWKMHPQTDISGRCILLLDDILDEGHTLLAIKSYLLAQGAEEVLSAVLVDKQHERKAQADLEADYTGLRVPDRYVFGYGMDYHNHWRNAAGIYALAAEDDQSHS